MDEWAGALCDVESLLADAFSEEARQAAWLAGVPPDAAPSARNLLHYLAVRRHDVRPLQRRLHRLGLSSLGRMESHVLATLLAVRDVLRTMLGRARDVEDAPPTWPTVAQAEALLAQRVEATLGPAPASRRTRIMVTMPTEAADDAALVGDLVSAGMDVARVNCAHDDPAHWARIARRVREAARNADRPVRVCFDLAGPKLRTGPIAAGPGVRKAKPLRDAYGRVLQPARIVLGAPRASQATAPAHVPVAGRLLGKACAGDTIVLRDARGRRRTLRVTDASDAACIAECRHTVYLTEGAALSLYRDGERVARGVVEGLPAREGAIELRAGDRLEIVRGEATGRDAVRDDAGRVREPARVTCPVDALYAAIRPGHRVVFDDGRIDATALEADADRIVVRVDRVDGECATLRGDRGINVPDTLLELAAIGDDDRRDLQRIVPDADLVALSFVQAPADVEALVHALEALDARRLAIVLKIETRRAFEALPSLLLTGLRHHALAVMVARGDLAVEVGYERLTEIQEEIVWLCEAAHVPVIWATQVLETLARTGRPSRAEVTDAGMAARSECVMLNKGPHIVDALRFLDDVLARMQAHHAKKIALLRPLSVSNLRAPST